MSVSQRGRISCAESVDYIRVKIIINIDDHIMKSRYVYFIIFMLCVGLSASHLRSVNWQRSWCAVISAGHIPYPIHYNMIMCCVSNIYAYVSISCNANALWMLQLNVFLQYIFNKYVEQSTKCKQTHDAYKFKILCDSLTWMYTILIISYHFRSARMLDFSRCGTTDKLVYFLHSLPLCYIRCTSTSMTI